MNRDDDINRVPVPKWKAIEKTPTSELTSARGLKPNQEIADSRVERALGLHERWRANPSLNNALELLDCSLFVEDLGVFSDAAAQILASDKTTRTSKMVAQSVLTPRAFRHTKDPSETSFDSIAQKISTNRKELRQSIRNALLHTEQARLYTIIGELDAAERSFATAIAIAPNNRHVLRSYSRFMFHAGEAETARRRLIKTSSIKHDPWLQAAEIALSEVSGKGSQIASHASAALNENRIPIDHRSELASALATLEHAAGNRKKFKKRFLESLTSPSDNALAQAMWFAREVGPDIEISAEDEPWFLASLRRSREALTYSYVRAKKWREAISSFETWQQEEQFSSHIAVQGSYYAVAFGADHEAAVTLCQNAIRANKTSAMLLNNLCVAQRRLGRVVNATETLTLLKSAAKSWHEDPTYLATDAMISFAHRDFDVGRQQYKKALEQCSKRNDSTLGERVKMHWIMEEVAAGIIDRATRDSLIGRLEATASFDILSEETKQYWKVMKQEIGEMKARDTVDSSRAELLSQSI